MCSLCQTTNMDCKDCGKLLSNSYSLRRHMDTIHAYNTAEFQRPYPEIKDTEAEPEDRDENQKDALSDEDSTDDENENTPEDYPWEDITDELVEGFREYIGRRKLTYLKEGIDDHMALVFAYADYKDKLVAAARSLILDRIKLKTALENDSIFRTIDDVKEGILNELDLSEDDAWEEAIEKCKRLFKFVIPKVDQFDDDEAGETEDEA